MADRFETILAFAQLLGVMSLTLAPIAAYIFTSDFITKASSSFLQANVRSIAAFGAFAALLLVLNAWGLPDAAAKMYLAMMLAWEVLRVLAHASSRRRAAKA